MLTITYDNYPFDERLETAWGFSCIIEGLDKTILFDTGGDGQVLLSNMKTLGFDPKQIDAVVLSHIHGDHTGGLGAFVQANPNVTVHMPKAFPADFGQAVKRAGATVVETKAPCQVCDGAWTTGVLGHFLPEQGLYLDTAEGLVLVTGCAHPGIVDLAAAAQRHGKKSVCMALGGFHMGGASTGEIRFVIARFKEMGIRRAAPCHCSGDATRRLMKEAFGDDYVEVGVGARLAFDKAEAPGT